MSLSKIRPNHSLSNPYIDPNFDLDVPHAEWKRPHQLVSKPLFTINGCSKFDINQGQLGDCWFLAAVQSLAKYDHIINHVLNIEVNTFDHNAYCGAFIFTFWRYGEYRKVLIDDRLPTRNGHLIYLNCVYDENDRDKAEFWPCLLEKAYAKLKGGYNNIEGGFASEAFTDMIGSMGTYVKIKDLGFSNTSLFDYINDHIQSGGFISCSTQKNNEGIVPGHAYSITKTAMLDSHALIRVRNPWGNFEAVNTKWADRSDKWDWYENFAEQHDFKNDNDGEFWLDISEFVNFFENLTISLPKKQGLAICTSSNAGKFWTDLVETDFKLEKGTSYRDKKFLPRIQFDLHERSKCMVSTMLKQHRRKDKDDIFIGFQVFKIEGNRRIKVHTVDFYRNLYEHMNEIQLERGKYEIQIGSIRALETSHLGFCRVWVQVGAI